jgi:hypothetical protein
MSVSVGSFVGKWWVHWVDGAKGWLQKGWRIDIGTGGSAGDSVPSFTGGYNVCVGFAVIDIEEHKVELSTEDHEGEQPLYFMLIGNQLQWKGFYDQQPLWIYISLSETAFEGVTYPSVYGSTTWGDPDQVGIWGGNGTPPPPPDPDPSS